MTLAERIRAEITETGPMRLDRYMELCLTDPSHGYYMTRDPLGSDFTTAPEISQMFGELIGLWIGQVWSDQGKGPVALVELGPGRGTLMADALRALCAVPGFHNAKTLHLVERSPTLRARQRATLADANPIFHDDVSTLPDTRLLVIANEFLDALPVRQYQRVGDIWLERCVGADPDLGFALQPAKKTLDLHRPDGTIAEQRHLDAVIAPLADRLRKYGGAALFIDYGSEVGDGDTLQAVASGKSVSPFANPGNADLTTHVRFSDIAPDGLRRALQPQGVFLEHLGITARAQQLATKDKAVAAQHRRLCHPDEMGLLFKVLGLATMDAPPLPGLET